MQQTKKTRIKKKIVIFIVLYNVNSNAIFCYLYDTVNILRLSDLLFTQQLVFEFIRHRLFTKPD